jgi:peptide/nickel transport system substrate-binding protein
VRGKTVDLGVEPWQSVWRRIENQLPASGLGVADQTRLTAEQLRHGKAHLVTPRLGQGAFRVLVTDAYHRRCAITGENVLPVLHAAHTRPFAEGGEHRIDSGDRSAALASARVRAITTYGRHPAVRAARVHHGRARWSAACDARRRHARAGAGRGRQMLREEGVRMLRRVLAACVVLGVGLVTVAGTSRAAPAPSGPTLRIAIAADPTGLDPESVLQNEAGFVLSAIYDGLTAYRPGTTLVQPGLASSWTISPSGRTYVFTLRRGVTFQDGTPLNAQAVVAWLDRIRNPHNPRYVGNQPGINDFNDFTFGGITSYKALGPDRVQIVLKQPNAEFLADLAMAWSGVTSPTAVTRYGYGLMTHPVGTGPFAFVRWVRGQYIELRANPRYWGGAPKLGEVFYEIVPESQVRVLELRQGKVQILADVPPSNVAALRRDPRVRVLTQPGLAVDGISLPTQTAPFNDVRVRQALNYAVDKTALNRSLFFGLATTMNSPDSPVEWSYAPQTPYTYDLNKAKALLKAAGYPQGFKATLYTYANPRGYNPAGGAKVAEAVQADLAPLGITISIRQMDFAAFLSTVRGSSFSDMASKGWSGDNGDPDDFMKPNFGCSAFAEGNYSHYCNQQVDAWFAEGLRTTSEVARKPIYARIEATIWKAAPWIFLNYATQVRAESADVHGYLLNPTEMFFDMQNVSLGGH